MRPSLHYFQGTSCSWCHSFAPTMDRIVAEWSGRLDVHVYAAAIDDPTGGSVLSAKALVAFRAMREEGAVQFAHRLQEAFFRDGMDLTQDATYAAVANEFDLDAMEFISLMHDDRVADAVQEEFDYVTALGIQGFPTVLYAEGDDARLLAHGNTSYDDMTIRLNTLFPR